MLAVSWDTIRLFLHVLAATIWVGGQLVLAALVLSCAGRAHRAQRPGRPVPRRPPGWINIGTERAGLIARPQDYRSISRAMTSCWIWLVPS